MILEYKVNEIHVEPAWLKTLYDLIEELVRLTLMKRTTVLTNSFQEQESLKYTVQIQCFPG